LPLCSSYLPLGVPNWAVSTAITGHCQPPLRFIVLDALVANTDRCYPILVTQGHVRLTRLAQWPRELPIDGYVLDLRGTRCAGTMLTTSCMILPFIFMKLFLVIIEILTGGSHVKFLNISNNISEMNKYRIGGSQLLILYFWKLQKL
jgi:hypothetical protein